MPIAARTALLSAAVGLAGCGDDDAGAPSDAAADLPQETAVDLGTGDVPSDAAADLGRDTGVDLGTGDVGPDAAVDLGTGDVGPDASPCGDGVCDFASETHANCPQDCGCAAIACAAGVSAPGGCNCDACCAHAMFMDCCDDADTACGITGPPCGNGACDIDCEDASDCSADCTCGDGLCDFSEDSCACLADCCGDGFCEAFCEDASNCPADC